MTYPELKGLYLNCQANRSYLKIEGPCRQSPFESSSFKSTLKSYLCLGKQMLFYEVLYCKEPCDKRLSEQHPHTHSQHSLSSLKRLQFFCWGWIETQDLSLLFFVIAKRLSCKVQSCVHTYMYYIYIYIKRQCVL